MDKEWKQWSEKDIKYLIKNYPTEDMKKMVTYLDRTDIAIKLKAHSLNIKRRKGYAVLRRILENQKNLMKQCELKSITIITVIIINGFNGFIGFNS